MVELLTLGDSPAGSDSTELGVWWCGQAVIRILGKAFPGQNLVSPIVTLLGPMLSLPSYFVCSGLIQYRMESLPPGEYGRYTNEKKIEVNWAS